MVAKIFLTTIFVYKDLKSIYYLVVIHIDDVLVNQDATAIFTDDDFLVHTNIELMLRRNLVVATAASITFNLNDSQTVTSIFSDTFVSCEKTFFDKLFAIFRTSHEFFLFFFSLFND